MADNANRMDRPGTERGEILDNRSCGAGAMADPDNLMSWFSGFHAVFDDSGVDIQIFVEEEIPDHGNPASREPVKQFL
jgi:hypothetical protein